METTVRLLLVMALACGRASAQRVSGTEGGAAADEFVGPFPSWANVKAEYGAAGDG